MSFSCASITALIFAIFCCKIAISNDLLLLLLLCECSSSSVSFPLLLPSIENRRPLRPNNAAISGSGLIVIDCDMVDAQTVIQMALILEMNLHLHLAPTGC